MMTTLTERLADTARRYDLATQYVHAAHETDDAETAALAEWARQPISHLLQELSLAADAASPRLGDADWAGETD